MTCEERLAEAEHRIQLFVDAVHKTAIAVGIANNDVTINAPTALLLLEDIAEVFNKDKVQT